MTESIESIELLGDGVEGITLVEADVTHFLVLMATEPGNGAVGRWLDALPTDRTFRIPAVINPVLAGMLQRRNWVKVTEFAPEFGEYVEVYERKAVQSDGGE